MIRPILVIGQSHVAAIRAAAKARREADPEAPRTRTIHIGEPRYAPAVIREGDAARFSDALAAEIRDQIARHAPIVASCLGGNVHAVLGLMRHPRPFDFRLGENDILDPQAEPLPLSLVRAALERAMAEDLLRLTLLAELIGPFVHLESPPPLADAALIAAQADAFFRDRAITPADVAPAGLRHRLWRLHGDIVRAHVEASGGRVLPVPARVTDAAGFLRPDHSTDATHGNQAYGEAVIAALQASAA